MEKGRLAILRSEIDSQVQEIEKIYTRIEERSHEKGRARTESLAYQLHNLYCAFEDLFKIVAGTFENQIEEKNRYHLETFKEDDDISGRDKTCFGEPTVLSTP